MRDGRTCCASAPGGGFGKLRYSLMSSSSARSVTTHTSAAFSSTSASYRRRSNVGRLSLTSATTICICISVDCRGAPWSRATRSSSNWSVCSRSKLLAIVSRPEKHSKLSRILSRVLKKGSQGSRDAVVVVVVYGVKLSQHLAIARNRLNAKRLQVVFSRSITR